MHVIIRDFPDLCSKMACAKYLFRGTFSRRPPGVGAVRLLLLRSALSNVECVGASTRRTEGSWRRQSWLPGLSLGAPLVRGKQQQVAAYYTKPKRRGMSGEALLMILGGSVALGAAGVFFMGEGPGRAAARGARTQT